MCVAFGLICDVHRICLKCDKQRMSRFRYLSHSRQCDVHRISLVGCCKCTGIVLYQTCSAAQIYLSGLLSLCCSYLFLLCHLPHPRRIVGRSRRQELPVGAERHASDETRVPPEHRQVRRPRILRRPSPQHLGSGPKRRQWSCFFTSTLRQPANGLAVPRHLDGRPSYRNPLHLTRLVLKLIEEPL